MLKINKSEMSEVPDITSLFRSEHGPWDPDSELGSIIYLTREPITEIPAKAIASKVKVIKNNFIKSKISKNNRV